MENYVSIVKALGCARIADLMQADAQRMFVTYEAPSAWYGFPPALVPIMSDGSLPKYVGIWRDWFGDRPDSFVDMFVSQDHHVTEIARTEAQFCDVLAARLITIHDDVSEEVAEYSEVVGLKNLDAIDAVTLETGDDPMGYTALPSFAEQCPRESCYEGYDGTFPVGSPQAHHLAFEFETPFLASDFPWLDENTDHRAAFALALKEGDLLVAWRHLNARGWLFAEAADALLEMSQKADDALFASMAEVWADHARIYDGGY